MIVRYLSRKRIHEVSIWIILIVLTFVPRIADLGLFLGHDEKMRNRQSLESFLAIVEGRWGDVYSSNFGGTNLTWARTGAKVIHFLWLRLQGVTVELPDMVNYGPEFDPLPGAVFNGLLLLAVFWFARKAFGQSIALVTTIILALDPYLLSESRILRTEAAYATFITLALISLAGYVRTRRRIYLAWSAFWSAWTIATKISGIMLAPVIGLVLLGMVWGIRSELVTTRRRLELLVIDMIVWSGVTIVCTFAIWPTLWVKPLQTFIDLYQFVIGWGLTGSPDLVYFFMGRTVDGLPPVYYLLVLLFKTTPLVWLGLGAFAWALWRSRGGKPDITEPTWAGVPFPLAGGLIMLLFAVLYSIAMAFSTFKTERYMMAVVCALGVVAAVGLGILGEEVYRKWQARQRRVFVFWTLVFVCFFVGHGLFTCINHPYYFSYYNPLLGGGLGAERMVQVGSGEGLDVAMEFLNSKSNPQELTVVCGTNMPRCEYVSAGQTILKQETLGAFHGDWVRADYVVTYVFQRQRGDYPSGVIDYLESHPGPEYVMAFQGIEYAKVYPAPHAQYVAASELTGISILLGYDLDKQTLAAGDTLNMKLYWENDGRIEHDMFVQLTDTDNFIWSESTASFSAGFEGLRDQVGAILEGEAELSTPVGMPPGRYYLKMGYKTEEGQLIGQFELPSDGGTIDVTLSQVFFSSSNPSYNLGLDLGGTLRLDGYDLSRNQSVPGEVLRLMLHWRATEDVRNDYVINLRLLDGNGTEVAYWLGRPVRSGYPTNTWRAGQIVLDPWRLEMPLDIAAGQYQLEIVFFDAETQEEVKRAQLSPVRVVQESVETQRPAMQYESGARFGEAVTLLGYDLFYEKNPAAAASISPNFYWQSGSDLQEAFDVLMALRSVKTGQAIKEWQVPLYSSDSKKPKTLWKAGEIAFTTYQLEVGDLSTERGYHLDLSLLNHSKGQLEPVEQDGDLVGTFLRLEDIQDKIVVRTGNLQ
jgi:hypothetical protein